MDSLSDLEFFSVVAKHNNLREAARQLGVTPPAVSKRLVVIERRLGVRLLQRTTRRASLTLEGETYLLEGAKILEDLESLERKVSGAQAVPRGVLRVVATLGFGRRHVSPALSSFARLYPEVEVQLTLTDRPVNMIEQGFDLGPVSNFVFRAYHTHKEYVCHANPRPCRPHCRAFVLNCWNPLVMAR